MKKNCSGVITETGSKGFGRADVVRTGDGAVWEIKHAGLFPAVRCALAEFQATTYIGKICNKGKTEIKYLGEAGAFSGKFCISIDTTNYEVNYRTPQKGVILYTVKETAKKASEYTNTYPYAFNANLKRLEESVVNIGGAVSPIPVAIAVPIPVGVPMFFGGGPFSTLEQAVK